MPQVSSGSSSKKRGHDSDDPVRSANHSLQKRTKLYPIFNNSGNEASTFRWVNPAAGTKHTCLHGINLEARSRTKIAAFDLDGTIIKSRFGTKGSSKGSELHWEWWSTHVPGQLKEKYEAGFGIVIISNQAISSSKLMDWKKKIPLIAAALPDVPFRIFAATAKDGYRKPMIGIWDELERISAEDGVQLDKAASFFVGDAAGRPGDFAATDRKWALNVGIPFFTPEEFFLKLATTSYQLKGFRIASLQNNLPLITPTSAPLIPLNLGPRNPEIVLFVGYPCLGKSTFFRRHFQPRGYAHVNQDTLGSRGKCIKAAESAILAGNSCVIDNTNRNAQTRKLYIDLAKKFEVPVRCFLFDGSIQLAWHNNLYRSYCLPASKAAEEPPRELLPYSALTSFRDNFEEPLLREGFTEIRKVNWKFEGDEEARWRWSMWLQIDGE